MSVFCHWSQWAPYRHGWRYDPLGDADPDQKTYLRVAYHHPDSQHVWFGATVCGAVTEVHGYPEHLRIVTAVQELIMPPKQDVEVFAIDEDEYDRLYRCEVIWWEDHSTFEELHPGAPEWEAVDFAHYMTVTEGRYEPLHPEWRPPPREEAPGGWGGNEAD